MAIGTKRWPIALVALALAACAETRAPVSAGGGTTSGVVDDHTPGACSAAAAGNSLPPVSTQLRLPLSWFSVHHVVEVRVTGAEKSPRGPDADRRILAVDRATALRTHPTVVTPSNDFVVSAQVASEVPSELARGAEVVVGVSRTGAADTVVSFRKDGTVEFLGVCRHRDATLRFEGAYQRVRGDGYRATRRDFLFAAIDNPLGPEARALSTTSEPGPSWEEVPEAVRIIAPDAVPPPPADLIATLHRVEVTLHLPFAWSRFDGGLCTRTVNGWTECVLLSATASGDVVLPAYTEPGERPQIWLVDDVTDLSTAVGKAGDADAEDRVSLAGDESVTTDAVLRTRIAAGSAVLA